MHDWLVLQLADATFPSGGFAHSGGLEAAMQAGALDAPGALERFLDDALWQAGHMTLPFVAAAHDAPERLAELDLRARRGARERRAQPREPEPGPRPPRRVRAQLRRRAAARPARGRAAAGPRHLAPVFGASLAVPRRRARRDAAAAPARHRARARLGGRAARARRAGRGAAPARCRRAGARRGAARMLCARRRGQTQTAPLHDLLAGGHELLYSRLFAS